MLNGLSKLPFGYEIPGEFEKIGRNPKFTMGIKCSVPDKFLLGLPGPGEYEGK